jgi:hypothetical protein
MGIGGSVVRDFNYVEPSNLPTVTLAENIESRIKTGAVSVTRK